MWYGKDDIQKVADPIFKKGRWKPNGAAKGVEYASLRWKNFRHLAQEAMLAQVREYVFPFIKTPGQGKDTSFSKYTAEAVFLIPTAKVLVTLADEIDAMDLDNKDAMGDVYEELLNRVASSGTNGQFRTPRHITELLIALLRPTLDDLMVDPAMGSAGFLLAVINYIKQHYAAELDRICAMKKNAEKRVEICQQLVKSKFVEMFGEDGTTRTPPLRCGVSSHHDYPVVTIGDVFHVGGPKRIHQSEWQDHGVPFLRISELSERLDGNKTKAEHYISNERYEELKAQGQVPVAGDVLVTARGTLGRCYVVGENDEFYFQDGMITWLSQKSEKIDLSYFLNAMKSDDFRRQYEGKMPGSTVAYLSIGQLAKLKLPLPPIGEQRQFAAYVAKVEKMEAVAREMVTTADMLYRAKL